MHIEPIKPENFANFPEHIVLHFLTRVCESSARDFCVLLLRICKVKCDWSIRPDVTEIVLGSSSQTVFFGGDKRQPEIGLRSQAINRVTKSFLSQKLAKMTHIT